MRPIEICVLFHVPFLHNNMFVMLSNTVFTMSTANHPIPILSYLNHISIVQVKMYNFYILFLFLCFSPLKKSLRYLVLFTSTGACLVMPEIAASLLGTHVACSLREWKSSQTWKLKPTAICYYNIILIILR